MTTLTATARANGSDGGRDPLLPQAAGTDRRGVALAVVAHLGLLAALTFSVNWRASPPVTVSAELWSAVPEAAAPKGVPAPEPSPPEPAPPPPPPPPPPPKIQGPAPAIKPMQPLTPPVVLPRLEAPKPPDIVIEQQRKKREAEAQRQQEQVLAKQAAAQKAKEAAERAAQQLADKKRQQETLRVEKAEKERLAKVEREEKAEKERVAKADAKRLAAQRKEQLDRMLGQAGSATGGTGTAARSSGPSAAYGSRLAALIRSNSVFTGTIAGNPPAVVEVRTGPSGNILSRRLVKSSGHPEWDEAVLRAIDRTARLPADTDGRVPAVLTIEFKPNE